MKVAAIIMMVSTLILAGVCIGEEAMDANATQEKDIVDTAIAANFTTLATALQAAELVDALKAAGPFTVFAPTDQAFANFTTAANISLESLVQDKANLTNVLKYHVVAGKLMSANLTSGSVPTLLEGKNLTINTTAGVMVNGAKVITPDISATNGVIHVIDTVLIP